MNATQDDTETKETELQLSDSTSGNSEELTTEEDN